MANDRKLRVYVDSTGVPQVEEGGLGADDSYVRRGRKDKFSWQMKNGPFKNAVLQIDFEESPFDPPVRHFETMNGAPTEKGEMSEDADGHYKYTITVATLPPNDPRIIIVPNFTNKLLVLGVLAIGAGVALTAIGMKLLKRHHHDRKLLE